MYMTIGGIAALGAAIVWYASKEVSRLAQTGEGEGGRGRRGAKWRDENKAHAVDGVQDNLKKK